MRKRFVIGVTVAAVVFGVAGAAYAGLLPTKPVVVPSQSGPIYVCPPGETLHCFGGVCWCW